MNGAIGGRPRIDATLGLMMDSHPRRTTVAAVFAAAEANEATVLSCLARSELKPAL